MDEPTPGGLGAAKTIGRKLLQEKSVRKPTHPLAATKISFDHAGWPSIPIGFSYRQASNPFMCPPSPSPMFNESHLLSFVTGEMIDGSNILSFNKVFAVITLHE